ncbi:6-phosphogluconate dehydrogenase [Reticulibacter mediterranei]|uniref:6-phosphogluconate dehydrogenase n=1 Tax=Reticulibacter mediterranei TaxID=2778369 RepID=A0A8J3IQ38_9CHLR|nr:NAD(P)-binding domain-containing protein [Reticulibacter mediterranei]GHO98118.1 6-phosphogluconate dehydrogenase [Reticulibacter mediterranei]
MSDVSIIGLGAMGTALAHTLLAKGLRVTVWNRTSIKAGLLVQEGAILASRAVEAIRASAVVIVCVHDYKTAYSILETEEVQAELAGRVLVQLGTGSPQQARDHEQWAKERGVDYLDGAIAATPVQIGKPGATIFVSGASSAFQKSESLLKILAGNIVYLGEQVAAASALDLAFLSFLFGSMLGFFHSARILESEGLSVASFGAMMTAIAPAVGEMMRHSADAIATDDYEQPESSLKICAEAVELLAQQAHEAGINAEFPLFASGLFGRAIAAGYGNEKAAALIKILRVAA